MKILKPKKTNILSAFFLAFFVLFFKTTAVFGSAMESLRKTNEAGFGTNAPKIDTISQGIGYILGIILSFLGVAFFLLIVYAGFKWMFARDNAGEVVKAREIITSAIIGLIVVLSAYAITIFLGGQLAT